MNHLVTLPNGHKVLAPAVTLHRFGLGDAVAAVAQPIARAIDRVAGTKVAGCGGCRQRHAKLNQLVPNINPFHEPR